MTTYQTRPGSSLARPTSRPTVDTPTALLPIGYERVEGRMRETKLELRRGRDSREFSIVDGPFADGPDRAVAVIQRHRAPTPRWHKPAKVAAAVAPAVIGIGIAVTMVVRSIAGAVTDTAPVLGGVAVFGLVLLVASALARSSSGRIVEGTFRGRIK